MIKSRKIIFGILFSVLLVIPILPVPHVAAASPTGVMIPLYSYPTNVAWSNLIAAKNAHPTVPVVAIINPNSGPGTSQSQTFLNGINNLKAAGITVLGYIPTNYAARSSTLVKADIDKYDNWYPVDGVKFDEMSNTSGHESYYSDLTTYAKSKGFTLVVGNPGADVPSSYIGTVDNLSIFENSYLPSLSYLGGWHTNYDKSNFSAESYNIATLDSSFVTSASQYVGYIYLTNDTLPNPWDTLSSYINDLLSTLESANGTTLTPSATSLTSNANPTVFGQTVTLTATVTGSGSTPTGTVTFREGATSIGSGVLSGGSVTLVTSTLSTGSHSMTAIYSGDSSFSSSTSPTLTQTVNKGSTTTTATSNTNPSVIGQSITFTATVSPVAPATGTRTGTVTFRDGLTTIGTTALSGGAATFTTASLSTGTHNISAVYSGDTNFNGSTSTTLTQTVNEPALLSSFTDVSSNLNPSTSDQLVTFTAAVTGSGSTPTGTVTFRDGLTDIGIDTLSGGVATFTTLLSTGSHNISASYGGNSVYSPSSSTTVIQTVNPAAPSSSTTSISSNLNPSTVGQSVTFTATVTSSGGTPTGTVTFYDGSTNIGDDVLSGSTAAFTTPSLTIGTHSISAVYLGDANFDASTSSTLTQTVNTQSLATSSTSISSNANPSVTGQSITFTALVSGFSGTPTGTVTFRDGSTVLGSGTLSGGITTFTTPSLSTGSHNISASYGGNSVYSPSTSTTVTQTVNKGSTTTSLTTSVNPSLPGQSITFTATVSPVAPATGTRTGTVTFRDGLTTIGTTALSGSTATFTTTSLSAGTHNVSAVYSGDTSFNGSTSATLTQGVTKISTTTTISSSLNPAKWRQPVTFTATITESGGTPTGTVTFYDGSTNIGSGGLSSNIATLTITSLAAGTHSITAVYSGDSTFDTSTSGALSQIIYKGGNVGISSSNNNKHLKINQS